MISTVSRESAPKSTNLASAAMASRSVPSCSEMMDRTLPRVSSLCARAVHTNQKSVSAKSVRRNRPRPSPPVPARRPPAPPRLSRRVESLSSSRVESSRTAAALTENRTEAHATGRAANALVGRARNCTCATHSPVTSRQSVGRFETSSVGRIYPARDPSRSRVVVARASSRDGRRGMSSETNGRIHSIHPTSSLERRPMSSLDARHRATRTDRPSSGCLGRGHRSDGWNATTRAVRDVPWRRPWRRERW